MLSPFGDDHTLFRIVRAAQLAPSVLNTQPWSLRVLADDRIELRAAGPEGAREPGSWLHFLDPLARELVISCGAALFNLRLAIRVTGHDLAVWLLPDPAGDPALLASVEIVTGRTLPPTSEEQELYDAIPRRHTNRWPFTGKPVPAAVLTDLQLTAAKERGWLRPLYPFQVSDWLRAAGRAQRELICDRRYITELRRWTTRAEAGLGIPAAAFGPQPESPRNPPVRDFNCTWRDGRPAERFESHPQLLSLATDDDRPLDWLRAGQALQRALLEGTRHGVAASFLTQSLELSDHRRQPRRWPAAWTFDEVPQMIIRVGYPAHPAPVTPREAAPDVVDLRGHAPRRVLPPGVPAGAPELAGRWHGRGRLPG